MEVWLSSNQLSNLKSVTYLEHSETMDKRANNRIGPFISPLWKGNFGMKNVLQYLFPKLNLQSSPITWVHSVYEYNWIRNSDMIWKDTKWNVEMVPLADRYVQHLLLGIEVQFQTTFHQRDCCQPVYSVVSMRFLPHHLFTTLEPHCSVSAQCNRAPVCNPCTAKTVLDFIFICPTASPEKQEFSHSRNVRLSSNLAE